MTDPNGVLQLCATQRLARNLQLADGLRRAGRDETVWHTLLALTVDAWLTRLGEEIALTGAAPADEMPARILSTFEEALVWRRVIEADAGLELFDLDSLAKSATEAHALILNWHLRFDENEGAEELQRFLGWRKAFLDLCRRNDWCDAARYRQRVCGWIEQGHGQLPPAIDFVGFDTVSPQLKRLAAALAARGVAVRFATATTETATQTQAVACADAEAECRAAAVWAKEWLEKFPAARLGIVVADLEARRALLTPILDEIIEPERLRNADDVPPTRYNLSLGLPLTQQAIAATALELLRALARPQGLAPAELGALLRLPYWAADLDEADLYAQLDARLRERPGQTVTIGTVMRLTRTLRADARLLRFLNALADAQANCKGTRVPSDWAASFGQVLAAIGWPGDRTLSSAEFQARAAFLETLDRLGVLDDILGPLPVGAAVGQFARLCAEKIFQPKTPGQPPVQVLGMLEAGGTRFDALWVMGLNDDRWPPPPRPNPLLPAEVQRRQATPGASAEVQGVFANKIHADLLRTAPEVVFSFAGKEGDRELRPSPLIARLVVKLHVVDPAAAVPPAPTFEFLDDALAPPIPECEEVAGGSGLLKAQALCPAWAYYRYRLGAKALGSPAEGLDAAQRGTLVHACLQKFWEATGGLVGLQALCDEDLSVAVAEAAEFALQGFEAELGEALTPTLRVLEANRLTRICLQWLRIEWDGERGRVDFVVQACEEDHVVALGPLRLRLKIDRIDVLTADGRKIVLDYKTGGQPKPQQWLDERLAEPQLPLYAAFVLAEAGNADGIAAVAFAKLKPGKCAFAGLAVANGLLPGVKALQDADVTAAWQALIDSWRERLLALAEEIRRGEAAVRFADEKDIEYCEVRPLLRVAERRAQFERGPA